MMTKFIKHSAIKNSISSIEYKERIDGYSQIHMLPRSIRKAFILRGLADENPKVRKYVVGILDSFQEESYIPLIISMTEDKNAEVRSQALIALSYFLIKGLTTELISQTILYLLEFDKSYTVRESAAIVAGDLDKKYIKELKRVLQKEEKNIVKEELKSSIENITLPSSDSSKNWYGAKCIIAAIDAKNLNIKGYEERIILIKAFNSEDAIEIAEDEVVDYCNNEEREDIYFRYIGFVNVYETFLNDHPKHLSEVYSLTCNSNLPPNVFLDKYQDYEKTS